MKIKKKLKKYGKGGEILEKKKIEDSFVEANNFLKTWQQSPMYNEMLNNSSSGNEYSKISNYRNKSLNLNPTNNLNVEKTLLNDPNTTGFVRKGTPVVNISSDWHNNNEMLSRLKTESDTLKARLGETPDYKIPTNFVTPSTIVHEMSHITDWKGLPKTDLQKIKNFSSDRDKNKFSNYVANPSETRSRLNEIRYENSLLKYYNPLTEKINKEQYNNYLKDKSKGNALKDLKNVYSDDEIIDMLNSISENKSSQEQVPMAGNGGKNVNTLEGDLYSKILLNRNKNLDFVQRAYAVGQYPESNMFQQFDPNEFGKKNSHLMGWGEDENGQAYMSPSIFNDRNEAIKVPNQYADYISNIGYKNATGIPTKQNGGKTPKYEWNKEDNTKIQPLKAPDYEPYSENINLDAYLKATQLFGDGVSFFNPLVGRLISAPGDINDIVKNPKDIKNYITPFIPTVSKVGLPLRQAAKIDRFNMVLTGATTLSDLPEETWQTPKKQNGGSINKYPNGGRQPKYEWSKGIDNIQPITQTQNNSSITTGNKKLSTEELKKAAEYTKKYNQQHLEDEYNSRQNKLKESLNSQKQPLSVKNLQTQTQSTGDKLSLAMNTEYGNPKDYPTLSGYIQGLDYINPFKMIGDMASGLGSAPQDVNEGNYLKAGLSLASPLAVGAIAGVGANSVKPFVNNLVNPLAGTGEVINNLGNKYLPNAYKLNPNAFKPNPNNFYRQVDTPTFNEGLESGLIRGKQDIGYSDESAMKMFGDDAYYNKGRLYYKNEKDYPYLFEANLPEDRFIPKVNGRTRKYTTENTRVRVSKEPLPINDPNIKTYKKDWLQGYKPIEIPKSNFKSEIDWSKWNKEIPENTQLMKEYNAIEQQTKANNTWMKNPDGSEFQGTPEQFVQQNSENFKKAFPEGSDRVYRGGNNENFSNDRGHPIVFTADKETARNYVGSVSPFTGDYELASPDAIGGRVLFDMYHPKNNSNLIINNQGKSWREISRNHFGENSPVRDLHNTKGDFTSTDDIAKWMVANDKNSVRLNNIFDSYDAKFVDIVNHKQGNYLKSATSNNGMFDMTNPNIYKALVPGVIGLGAASQIDKKEFGGNITRESEWELVNEDLPKAGNGLSLVKTLTPIGNKVIPRNPSLYKDAINNVDKIEHNINDRYRVQADDFTDKNYPTDYDEDSGHNDYVDALRHSATAMYTTSGQGDFLAPLKVPYTNVMGLAHELKGLGSYVSNPDKLTWQGAKQQLRETGSDLYNNFVGSMIGGLPINIENKEKILKFAKDKNILSDLSKKQNGGKLPKRRLNLNKSSDWEIVD